MKRSEIPKVMLIGAGKFGLNYLRILKNLEKRDLLNLVGVVVKTNISAKEISKSYKVKAFNKLRDNLLKNVDGVFIVTPPETHYNLIKYCAKQTNVFVEKPLTNEKDSSEKLITELNNNRIVMVGHIFRFHPAIKKLKKLFGGKVPKLIKGEFINPIKFDNKRNISLEMLHLYDMVDYLFNKMPEISTGRNKNRTNIISLRYPNGMDAIFEIGWKGEDKKRDINFYFKNNDRVLCDLEENTIKLFKVKITKEKLVDKVCDKAEEVLIKTIDCKNDIEPLEEEILTFLKALKNKTKSYPDLKVGARIVNIATSINYPQKESKPKVAIIGGGIFGTNCAIKLADFCDVTLFERNNDLMREASFVNQYRHHEGFHYPRSQETVEDIKKARINFEKYYNNCIIRHFPTYYSVAKENSRVSAEQYLKFCRDNKFSFKLEHPDPTHVNREKITISLKTLEPIYDYAKLQKTVKSYLSKKDIKIKLETEVINGSINKNGKKVLLIKEKDKRYKEEYDFVINVTYANLNKFAYWFNFPIRLLRVDLVEALNIRLPIPKISFAIMDGPFTNLVPTSEDNKFTLVHIKDSMLKREVLKDGLIPDSWNKVKSNRKKIIEESLSWLPILKEAEVLESRYVFRGVNAYREHDDARPSDIIHHGFGCWSILGGKIINCVDTAIELSNEIKQQD